MSAMLPNAEMLLLQPHLMNLNFHYHKMPKRLSKPKFPYLKRSRSLLYFSKHCLDQSKEGCTYSNPLHCSATLDQPLEEAASSIQQVLIDDLFASAQIHEFIL